ncbi:MmgE/PrpD family protein [Caballeronia sp. LP006]|uniref:MmgE/PrpD family protein n=1 Tax=Caballeronia sp. LP006 TaxID=3038552 RepID=UPI002857BB31|nr:MmgE/PrpD family protein [Caballeronia sp. LP006]MDR5832524.1 MmgE/PrpD family protein [Caballeronia sp. LP006]
MALTASQTLASFAVDYRDRHIPDHVLKHAKYCLIDTVAAATYGAEFPWSKAVIAYAERYGIGGTSTVLGTPSMRVHAPMAALANGALAHAFEMDSIREPSAGVHAGATIAPAAFAVGEECDADGLSVLKAFILGTEVASRIGVASHHSPEKIGFHAPGMTGPFGAAIAAGLLMGLDAEGLTHALGLAGSLTSGLMTFSKARHGSMVKRLHPGRAAESGVLAARLAASGFEGPESILDGKFGFLDAYCRDLPQEVSALTANLGEDWETLRTGLKRYACHANAQTATQSAFTLRKRHAFQPQDVDHILIEGHERLIGRHDNTEPLDIMQGQYSVPFCVALALSRDPNDPRSFSGQSVNDPKIRALSCKVRVATMPVKSVRHTRVTIRLLDGTVWVEDCEAYKGMPTNPVTLDDIEVKFKSLTRSLGDSHSDALFHQLITLEKQDRLLFA